MKYGQIPIAILFLEEFYEVPLDAWIDEEYEFPCCKFSFSDIQKKVLLIEKSQYDVLIIMEFHDWLISSKHLNPPSDCGSS